MADPHKNFAYSTVATAPSPATSGTSLVVESGHGARFPAVPFNATVWPASGVATPDSAEVVRVTAVSTDTFTITRAQEGSSARTVVIGDRIAATITSRTLVEAEETSQRLITQTTHGFDVGHVLYHDGSNFALAQADDVATAEVVGIVAVDLDANRFVLHYGGRITGLSGLTAGDVYFLSAATPGLLTATEPTANGEISKPLLVADSTTSGYFFNFRGVVVSDADLTAWQDYTPALTASTTNPTLGSGSSVYGRYKQIGKTMFVRTKITFGTSGVGAGSGTYRVSIPTNIGSSMSGATGGITLGHCHLTDNSDTNRGAAGAVRTSAGSADFVTMRTHGMTGTVSNTIPWTWAASDAMELEFSYEVD